MKQFEHFYYDGIYSKDMGVTQASLDSGLFDELFMANRTIMETKVKGNPKPYFHGFEYDPLEFSLTLYFEDGMSETKIRNVARWLTQQFYKPLYFEDNPSYVFYCLHYGDSRKIHNGIEDGVITLQMRCKDAFIYSPVYLDDEIDLSENPVGGTNIQFSNKSDVSIYPEMWITKIGDGDISITNNSNGGEIMQLTELYDQEIVYIDCENEQIESDIPGQYRYESHNGVFMEMIYGVNNLIVEGNCKYQVRYQYKFLTSP